MRQPDKPTTLRPWRGALGFGSKAWVWLFYLLVVASAGAGEISRAYDYRGFDNHGNLLVQGVITLRLDKTSQVRGEWKMRILDRAKLKELGPQDGAGKILGQLKGDTIFLNLNPEMYENNIFLDGRISRANIFTIKGKWGFFGFVGKLNDGTFELVRRNEAVK